MDPSRELYRDLFIEMSTAADTADESALALVSNLVSLLNIDAGVTNTPKPVFKGKSDVSASAESKDHNTKDKAERNRKQKKALARSRRKEKARLLRSQAEEKEKLVEEKTEERHVKKIPTVQEEKESNQVEESKATIPKEKAKAKKNKPKEKKMKPSHKKRKNVYEPYLSAESIKEGLDAKRLFKGDLRVNAKNQRQCYVTVEGFDRDILIEGKENQNRATHNDIVYIEVIGEQTNREEPRMLGKVVAIDKRGPSSPFLADSLVVGYLQGVGEKGSKDKTVKKEDRKVIFIPQDPRDPIGYIFMKDFPEELQQEPEKLSKILLSVKYDNWSHFYKVPICRIVNIMGESGELTTDLEALLQRFEITYTDVFPMKAMKDLDDFQSHFVEIDGKRIWKVPDCELARRLDLRDKCIFSIDPPTARDLDDALSIERLSDGVYEIGVHIADVSFFVKENSALDLEARFRGTSVYLVDRVIPMLPRMLCEDLCSLNPKEDRLAFSIFWRMTESAGIDYESAKFHKTVIKSCAKFAYGSVQQIIDAEDSTAVAEEILSDSLQGTDWSPKQIAENCKMLHRLAMARRKHRFSHGSLALDSVALKFETDPRGLPIRVQEYERTESHYLVEEFMLLANEMAARRVSFVDPERGLLRRHPAPDSLERLQLICDEFKVEADLKDSLGIHRTIQTLRNVVNGKLALGEVIEHLFVKQMKPAQYFCVSGQDQSTWHHFNLNLDFYTHFTSPIRRYADLVVHRLLAQHLQFQNCHLKTEEIKSIAKTCNERNSNSRYLEMELSVLYFCHLLKHTPSMGNKAVLVDMGKTSFKLFLVAFGMEEHVNCSDIVKQSGALESRIEGEDFSLQKKLVIKWSEECVKEYALFETLYVKITQRETMRTGVTLKVLRPGEVESVLF